MRFIITADDFWISKEFNKAIIDLIRKNCLFSVSVIIRKETNKKQIEELLSFKDSISIWLHFEYTTTPETDNKKEIKKELYNQYDMFIKLFNKKPDFINKHNREKSENEARTLCDFASKHNIPIRLYTRGKNFFVYNDYKSKIKITHDIYNLWSKKYWIEKIKKDFMKKWNKNKIYEVICHPWFFDKKYDSQKNGTPLNKEREEDYKKVIELNSFFNEKKIKATSFRNI
jgi:predicted glycoside hydrolase/deacetylase ChbG (UPF0249 family)